jgi:hypothetical protein
MSEGTESPVQSSGLYLSILMVLIVTAFAAQRTWTIALGGFVCAIYALWMRSSSGFSRDNLLIVVGACILFVPGFFKLSHGLSPQFYFASTCATFFAAVAASRHSPKLFLRSFHATYVAAILAIAAVLYAYWDSAQPLGMAIEGSSTNGIPSYLIVIQVGLSLASYLVKGRLPLLSPLTTGAVAFFGNGRGSLVVAGMIIVISAAFNIAFVRDQDRLRRAVFLIIISIVVTGMLLYATELSELSTQYTKLSVGLVDENRLEILNQYLGKINPWTAIVGADYTGTVIDYEYNGNPHISYIRTHSLFGLPITVLALVSPLIPMLSDRSWKDKLVFSGLIALAAARALSEPIFFPTLLDFFYFTYFFLFFRYATFRTTKCESWGRVTEVGDARSR